jgi:hypothetical protein
MTTGDLLIDIIKTGTVALIGTKVTKAIGQKEISEIINGTGWLICGVDIVLLVTPIIKTIQCGFDKVGAVADKISYLISMFDKIPGIGK